jgi:hypothetical protein
MHVPDLFHSGFPTSVEDFVDFLAENGRVGPDVTFVAFGLAARFGRNGDREEH